MAKIDILKNKARYNKDLTYQLTGKDLKILIDYIENTELLYNAEVNSIITEVFTIDSYRFTTIWSDPFDITPVNAEVFIPLSI